MLDGAGQLRFRALQIVFLLQRDAQVVVRHGGVRVALEHRAKLGGRPVELGLLQVREPDIQARHRIARVRREDLLELRDALRPRARC